jgi:nitrate reductase NapE component
MIFWEKRLIVCKKWRYYPIWRYSTVLLYENICYIYSIFGIYLYISVKILDAFCSLLWMFLKQFAHGPDLRFLVKQVIFNPALLNI